MTKLYDDSTLLDRLKAGDHHAFEKIYHLYKIKLTSNLLRLLKSPDLAEELLQELFIKIWEQRQKIDPDQSINAYLYKVAQNMVYDRFRKISRDKRLHDHLMVHAEIYYDHIEKQIFTKENRHELTSAIKQLPVQQQKVYVLCKLEEKSAKEVSELLNISTGTINNHLYRANIFLKQYFTDKEKSAVVITFLTSAILKGIQ